MQRHAFRSVCSRTRPELEQASDALRDCIRQFSTTQLQAAESNGPSNKPSLRERSRAATTEINSLARSRSPNRAGKPPMRAPMGAVGGAGAAGGPKVLDVKSLPRLSIRGRGGAQGPQGLSRPGITPRGGLTAAPQRGAGRPTKRRGGFSGRGRGRGGARKTGQRSEEEDKEKEKERRSRRDEFSTLDADEQEFDDNMRFGLTTEYSPSLTLDSLADFAPAVPTSSIGQTSTVVQNLSVLGTADHPGTPQTLLARHPAAEIGESGVRFFADAESREAAERYLQDKSKAEGEGSQAKAPSPIITDAEDAVRKVILEKAVKGQHEAPKFASDPIGVSRSWHLRAETYTPKDVNSFETKLVSLLSKAPKTGSKPAAKEAQA